MNHTVPPLKSTAQPLFWYHAFPRIPLCVQSMLLPKRWSSCVGSLEQQARLKSQFLEASTAQIRKTCFASGFFGKSQEPIPWGKQLFFSKRLDDHAGKWSKTSRAFKKSTSPIEPKGLISLALEFPCCADTLRPKAACHLMTSHKTEAHVSYTQCDFHS